MIIWCILKRSRYDPVLKELLIFMRYTDRLRTVKFYFFIWEKELQKERKRHRAFPSAGLFTKCLQRPGMSQDARIQELYWGFLSWSRARFCYFARCISRKTGPEVEQLGFKQATIWDASIAGGCLIKYVIISIPHL